MYKNDPPTPQRPTVTASHGLSEAQTLSNFILQRLKGDVTSSTLAEGRSGAAATALGAHEGT